MKRSSLTPLSRLPRSTKKLRPTPTTAAPRPTRSRPALARNPVVAARAARASYFNAFCAFLHTPAQ